MPAGPQTLMIRTPTTGMAEIQRAALYVLVQTLNDAIELVQAHWVASDQAHATMMSIPYEETVLEPIELSNFYEGHKPSLIGASIDKFPNVSVMAKRATPDADSGQWDHQEKYRVPLTVEVMVKASAEEGEEVCNRRCHRLVDAVNTSMMTNQSLGGIVSGFITAPTTSIGEIFTSKKREGADNGSGRSPRTAYGPEWFWQIGRLEYAVRKEAATPSHGKTFRSAPTYTDLNIDQA